MVPALESPRFTIQQLQLAPILLAPLHHWKNSQQPKHGLYHSIRISAESNLRIQFYSTAELQRTCPSQDVGVHTGHTGGVPSGAGRE
jgi:hypothetical protein